MRCKSSLALALSLAASIFLTACGGTTSSSTPPAAPPDIYIAGYHGDTPAYWKNGKEVDLNDGTNPSVADGIAVSGTTVVAAGYSLLPDGSDQAYVWNNGVQSNLDDNGLNTEAFSVAISGSDIYAAGESYDHTHWYATYWKNGTAVHLTPNSDDAAATHVFISGSDVYFAGYKAVTTQTAPNSYYTADEAVYWKNGTEVDLTNGQYPAQGVSIAVSGTDVYVSGYQCFSSSPDCILPMLWTNGVGTQLSADYSYFASGLAIANDTTWVTSGSPSGPIAYQNESVVNLETGDLPAGPYAAAAYNQDFYSAGLATDPTTGETIAIAWMNQTQIFTGPTTEGGSAAYSIVAVAPAN